MHVACKPATQATSNDAVASWSVSGGDGCNIECSGLSPHTRTNPALNACAPDPGLRNHQRERRVPSHLRIQRFLFSNKKASLPCSPCDPVNCPRAQAPAPRSGATSFADQSRCVSFDRCLRASCRSGSKADPRSPGRQARCRCAPAGLVIERHSQQKSAYVVPAKSAARRGERAIADRLRG